MDDIAIGIFLTAIGPEIAASGRIKIMILCDFYALTNQN